MLIDKKVQKYVHAAAASVPAKERGRLTRELTDMIYEMMEGYAGDHEPDILDCRDVLRDLGTPEQAARNYMESKETKRTVRKHARAKALGELVDGRRMEFLRIIYLILAVAAAGMVIVGIIGLATQGLTTTLPIFLGVVIEVLLAVMRSIFESKEIQKQE